MHKSVLLHEVVSGLDIKPGDIVVDATLGAGGHSEAIIKTYGPKVTIVAIDQDSNAIVSGRERLSSLKAKIFYHTINFKDVDQALTEDHIDSVSAIIFDFGFSSDQLESSGRGFSFLKDEPLLMTMSPNAPFSAQEVVNTWAESSLKTIISEYGEERFTGRIARSIVEARKEKPILTTTDLVTIITNVVPSSYRYGRIHPATKTFQALRIVVNDELKVIEEGLKKGFAILRPGGRIAAISFHSLEDRIVKRFFKEEVAKGNAKIINKKPITPTDQELDDNPRSRSAKLRFIEKL